MAQVVPTITRKSVDLRAAPRRKATIASGMTGAIAAIVAQVELGLALMVGASSGRRRD